MSALPFLSTHQQTPKEGRHCTGNHEPSYSSQSGINTGTLLFFCSCTAVWRRDSHCDITKIGISPIERFKIRWEALPGHKPRHWASDAKLFPLASQPLYINWWQLLVFGLKWKRAIAAAHCPLTNGRKQSSAAKSVNGKKQVAKLCSYDKLRLCVLSVVLPRHFHSWRLVRKFIPRILLSSF